MKPLLVSLFAVPILAVPPARAQELSAKLPPIPSPVASAGSTVAGTGSRAFRETGGFFGRAGDWAGRGCADIFVRQGRFWKRTANTIFADFQEKPAGTPPRYDQM